MNKPVQIGFLAPHSGVYPFWPQHLPAGMMVGHGRRPSRRTEIQVIVSYTYMRRAKQNEEAATPLLFFDQVDVLSCLVSYLSVTPLIPLLESLKKIGVFLTWNNSGNRSMPSAMTGPNLMRYAAHRNRVAKPFSLHIIPIATETTIQNTRHAKTLHCFALYLPIVSHTPV